ncbi:MAG: chemotaxis protein CheW [Dehalococcoidia bacterium]|nr:chemotaxis protein CheW [Dehalococcoidia bacterium]
MVVTVSGSSFIVPLVSVMETIKVKKSDIMAVQMREVMVLRNMIVPLMRMSRVLGIGAEEESEGEDYVLVVKAGDRVVGIVVDEQVEHISVAAQQLGAMSAEMVKLSENISAVVEQNTAATEQMSATANSVSRSVEDIAGVAEQNSAATEGVSAAAEEISAQMQQMVASGAGVSQRAQEFKEIVLKYKIGEK